MNNKKFSIKSIIILTLIVTSILFILSYYFWPKTLKFNMEVVSISIDKHTESVSSSYDLNEQEVYDFINILKKSKLYNGVSRPDYMFGDKLIDATVRGEEGGVIFISIYYDTNKTYVYANISNNFSLNAKYRISNKDDIRIFIESIINNPDKDFVPFPSS